MPFEAVYTNHFEMPYFSAGMFYSGEADMRRFFTLDYNMESFIGVIGAGVIEGWEITAQDGLQVTIGYGTAIINSFFSESPFDVKERSLVLPTDTVIQQGYYIDGSTYYDKVLNTNSITLSDNADNYIYIYRNAAYQSIIPYYEPNNDSPTLETNVNKQPSFTAVAFGVTTSYAGASSGGRMFVGLVVTRNGVITEIDTSKVASIKSLESSIIAYGQHLLQTHQHGGAKPYDPPHVILRTDIRRTVLTTAKGNNATYKILYSDPTGIELGHRHYFSVDDDGDGLTVETVGTTEPHYHNITRYVVGDPVTDSDVLANHTHTMPISVDSPDTWNDEADYAVYINDEPYEGTAATVYDTRKEISFTADVTVTNRRFLINHTLSDGVVYRFEQDSQSLFWFVLSSALDFYNVYGDDIRNGTRENIFIPDPATPVTILKEQSLVGETVLVEAGDVFRFVGDASPEEVVVTLVDPGHVDEVKVEVVSNSEVTGKLRAQNVLYIPAEKFKTGTFAAGRIPILNHLGRYLEECSFDQGRMYSYDGLIYYENDDLGVPWGNIKVVYGAYDDTLGNLFVSTADGIYKYPPSGAYKFFINGEMVITSYGDLSTRLVEAALQYTAKTGVPLVIDDDVYEDQITAAEEALTSDGSHYEITGQYNAGLDPAAYDKVHVFYVSGYRLPNFGYEAIRFENEILEDEEIIKEIEMESTGDTDETGTTMRLFLVRNDFNRYTVRQMVVEYDSPSAYNTTKRVYFAISSAYIAKTSAPDVEWELVRQSVFFGYIYDLIRTYKGYYVAATSNGFHVCLTNTGQEYRRAELPDYNTDIPALTFGYDDLLIAVYENNVIVTEDYGNTWTVTSPSSDTVRDIFFDPTLDKTNLTSAHYHKIVVDQYGNGATTTVYDAVGTEITNPALIHTHIVTDGVIADADGHSHTAVRTFYMIDSSHVIYSSTNGATWSLYGTLPVTYTEYGPVFGCFGYVMASTIDGVLYSTDGVTWSLISDFSGLIYGVNWNRANTLMYWGGQNVLYTFDGVTITSIKTYDGVPFPAVHVGTVCRRFGYLLNNKMRSVDFLGDNMYGTAIEVVSDFNECYPEQGGWDAVSPYDLYLNDRMIKSTKDDSFAVVAPLSVSVSNGGIISFAQSAKTTAPIDYGNTTITVDSAVNFPTSGYLRILYEKDDVQYAAFFQYSTRSGTQFGLSAPSQINVEGNALTIDLIPDLDIEDNILITVYESKLINVGLNTHEDVENALSMESVGSPKRFADVYLTNLLHLTTAVKYFAPTVDDEYKNHYLTLFQYNDIPGDPDYLLRHLDRTNSDLYSLIFYASSFRRSISVRINRIFFGYGAFVNTVFVASELGLFAAKTNVSLEANWFRISLPDDSAAVYDVAQIQSGKFLVCTNEGTYFSIDPDLEVWTQIQNEVLGGAVQKIKARWTDLVTYERDSVYWWAEWSGIINTNPDLINSIIVSGNGFLSVTDDYGETWQKGEFHRASQYELVGDSVFMGGALLTGNHTFTDPFLFHDGSSMIGVNGITSKSNSVYRTTGTGIKWDELFNFPLVECTLTSYTLTDYGNIRTIVKYEGSAPAEGNLRGSRLYCNDEEFLVIENVGNEIVIFGDSFVDATSGEGDEITILPFDINALAETQHKDVLLGTSNGIFTDAGSYFSGTSAGRGTLVGLGNKGVVTSLNVTGDVSSIVFASSDRVMISTTLSKVVRQNELLDFTTTFASLPDMKVLRNDSTKSDGQTVIVLETTSGAIPIGTKFTIVGEENRIYCTFDETIGVDQLKGGKVFIEPHVTVTTPMLSSVVYFTITGSGSDYVQIAKEFNNPSNASLESLITPGVVIYCTNSDGTVPVYVEFIESPVVDKLQDNKMVVTNVSSNVAEAKLLISSNTEISVAVSGVNTVAFTSNALTAEEGSENYALGLGVGAEVSAYHLLFPGTEFTLERIGFDELSSFNFKSSSKNSNHRHTINLYGKVIQGNIDSLGNTTSAYVDLHVSGADGLSDALFAADASLLEGERMVAYDPELYARSQVLTIVSATSSVIRVKNNGSYFDTLGDAPKKVGSGWKFIINARRYGTTTGVDYTVDFVTQSMLLTADTYVGGTTFTVTDTSGLTIGENVSIRNRDGLLLKTTVTSTPTVTTFTTKASAPYDFLVSKDSYVQVHYTNLEVGSFLLTADAAFGDMNIKVSSTSDLVTGDVVYVTDDKGMIHKTTVSSITDSTTVVLSDALEGDFYVVNIATARFVRPNFDETHEHSIKDGEFSKVSSRTWHARGYDYSHGHLVAPLIREVNDIKFINGKIYVVGNSKSIYSSYDGGSTWTEEIDLTGFAEFVPLPSAIQKIETNGSDILFGTSSGYLVYYSTSGQTGIIPLEVPIG